MTAPLYRPGSWCDVFALPDGRLGQVVVYGATVTCYVESDVAWVTEAPEGLLFCRATFPYGASDPQSVHQGQSGAAWFVTKKGYASNGIAFGAQPVAFDAYSVFIVRSALNYDRIDLEDGVSQTFTSGAPGSSQGISDVPEPNDLWWADLHRSVVVNSVTLTYPNQRGGLMVGQCDAGGVGGSLNGGAVRWIIDAPTACFEPHIATDGHGRYAVCARTPNGAAWRTFTASEFEALPPVVTPEPPIEPPTQPPTEPPTEPPVRPPVPPLRAFPRAYPLKGIMTVYLLENGKYCGVEPGTKVVYADRPAGGAWEEVILSSHDGGLFEARFAAADLTLSIQPDGSLETRPAGTFGAYEQLRATSQPEGIDILYREDGGTIVGVPLTIQER